MCGIVGYSGAKSAADVILEGLTLLEYRGYDSAGISLFSGAGLETVRSAGRLSGLVEKVNANRELAECRCGIGHTRWATHGAPSERNAHPHATAHMSLVHNGIVENYRELRVQLLKKGYVFESDTDTEIAAKFIDSLYDGDPFETLSRAGELLDGSFAFAVLFTDHPGRVYGIRKSSPLIAGLGEGEGFLASDISALLTHTRSYIELDEGEVAEISPDGVRVRGKDGEYLSKDVKTAHWSAVQAQKGGYEHFMLKEIHEQPEAMMQTLKPRIHAGLPDFSIDALPAAALNCGRIRIVACGTAMHAGLLGRDIIEKLAQVPVEVELASEFRYRNPPLSDDCLVMAISQSGETADTLAALRLAKKRGLKTLAIVNVPGSSLSREADMVLYTHAGPEISVASTKAFSVQVGLLYLVGIALGLQNGRLEEEQARHWVSGLLEAVDSIGDILARKDSLMEFADKLSKAENIFYIGRSLDYPLGMEGSLKLKEITYIHSEAYAAGELKHGAISLIVPGMPVVALATQAELVPKIVSNAQEAVARGGDILFICRENDGVSGENFAGRIPLPDLDDLLMPIPTAVTLQLLAYYAAKLRGCDIDKPRNLAKSVTVE